jgi:hypothetical protein
MLPHPTKRGMGDKPSNLVVYADGINPDVDAFDDWWAEKRRTFGGDDGADVIPLRSFQAALAGLLGEKDARVEVEITPTTLGVLVPALAGPGACRYCHAKGDDPCVTKNGKPTSRHKGRTS